MLKVHLPDGSVKEYSHRVRPLDIAADIGPRHIGLACNVVSKSDCERAVRTVLERLGRFDDAILIAKLDKFRKKRNISDCEQAGTVSDREAAAMVELARELTAGAPWTVSSLKRSDQASSGRHKSWSRATIINTSTPTPQKMARRSLRLAASCK